MYELFVHFTRSLCTVKGLGEITKHCSPTGVHGARSDRAGITNTGGPGRPRGRYSVQHTTNDSDITRDHKHSAQKSTEREDARLSFETSPHLNTAPGALDQHPQAKTPMPKTDVCQQIHEHLVRTHGSNRVSRYLSGTVTMTHSSPDIIELVAGDRFTLDMIERRLGESLRIGAQFAMGTTEPKISYRVDTSRNSTPSSTGTGSNRGSNNAAGRNAQSNAPASGTHPLASRIENRPYGAMTGSAAGALNGARFPSCPSLNDFLVGSSNRLALESIKQVIQAGTDCPPVFVHGSCGVGKNAPLKRRDPIRTPAPPWMQGSLYHRRSVQPTDSSPRSAHDRLMRSRRNTVGSICCALTTFI